MPERAPELGVPQEGELVAGKYRVERELATGGMGIVLLATEKGGPETSGRRRRVAIKVMLPQAMEIEGAVTRFQREAQAAAGIESDHVVQIFEVGTLPTGAPFMVMEFLEGEDLAHVIKPNKTIAPQLAVDYVLQACEAMAQAHKLGIVHRDLKPSNLFLTNRSDGAPCVKVLDFGISKFTAGSEVLGKEGASLTATRAMMGSPLYMSPEQVRSAKNVDRRTDIWSLGVILYELLSGRLPFEADTAGAICAMIVADEPVPLEWMNKELPEELARVVMRCLAKEPALRFQDVAELAAALRPFASMLGDAAAENAAKTMEHASGILPTLHAAPIKLDLQMRAQSAPLAKTSVATPTGRREVQARSEPPPPIHRPTRSRAGGGRVVAALLLFGGVAYGAWHFRARFASEAAGLSARADTAVDAGASPEPQDATVDAPGAAGTLVDLADAALDAEVADASFDAADADLDADTDASEDDDLDDDDDAAVAVAVPARPHVAPKVIRPKHRAPTKKKRRTH